MLSKLLLMAAMIAQADLPPGTFTCQPEEQEANNAGEVTAWSCRDESHMCELRQFDRGMFERSGAELVYEDSSTEAGTTARTVMRIQQDGRFEEVVEWRDAAGQSLWRQVMRGRCELPAQPG